MNTPYNRTGPLMELSSYPEWAQKLVADCAADRARCSSARWMDWYALTPSLPPAARMAFRRSSSLTSFSFAARYCVLSSNWRT